MISTLQVGRMKLEANLPHHIHAFRYVKNHHYIELEDKEGNRHKVNATGLLKGECNTCGYVFYSDTNRGDIVCPACKAPGVLWAWGRLQLCFIPEQESDFQLIKPGDDNE